MSKLQVSKTKLSKPKISKPKVSKPSKPKHSSALLVSGVLYDVFLLNPLAHTFKILLTLDNPCADQELNFPEWIAGSYMLRDFSKNLHNLGAKQNNKNIPLTQLSKASWRVHCKSSAQLTIEYDIYAHDPSVRGAWLDDTRAFFNGTSLFFECAGFADKPHFVKLHKDPILPQLAPTTQDWSVFTSLKEVTISSTGWGLYSADTFEDLVDTPVLMSQAWHEEFEVGVGANAVKHRLVLNGAPPSFDGAKLLADTQLICKTIIDFWHSKSKPVIKNYLFIVNVVQDGYGGLEHKTSTVLQCKRSDLPSIHKSAQTDAYIGLLGLISHEYFHTWNVKRLRPTEFERYRFNVENYTEMLWFFEGFTSYYDDLLLRRAQLINDQSYLKIITKNIQQVLQTPGRRIQSVAQASYDAWIKYYKQDENTPNITVSYYTKGALIALCFDLKLRAHNSSLDAVMKELFKRFAGGPICESDFKTVLEDLSQRAWDKELLEWVHGVEDPPYAALLQNQGIKVEYSAEPLQQQLGMRTDDTKPGVHIKFVLSGGLAEQAGFVPGDEWIGVEVPHLDAPNKRSKLSKPASHHQKSSWRINKLDELSLFLGESKYFDALVCRDQKLLLLRVQFNMRLALANKKGISLCIKDASQAKRWLEGKE